MASDSKNNFKIKSTVMIVILVMISLIAVLWWIFNNKNERHVSSDKEINKSQSLNCISGSHNGLFFESDMVISVKHNIKILFRNNSPNSISYIFDASYPTEQQAKTGEAILHVYYSKYMIDNGSNGEVLNPVFSVNGTEINFLLHSEWNKLDSVSAKVFLIDRNDFEQADKYDINDFAHLYENKGFICEIK